MKKYFFYITFLIFSFSITSSLQAQKKAPATIDWSSSKLAPTVVFENLMWQSIALNETGVLQIKEINCVFLPKKDILGKPVNYYDDKNARIFARIYKENELLKNIPFHISSQVEKQELEGDYHFATPIFNVIKDDRVEVISLKLTSGGKYRIEFCLDEKPFYKTEIDIIKKTSDDIYSAQKDFYFMKGIWNNYIYTIIDPTFYSTDYSAFTFYFFGMSYNRNDEMKYVIKLYKNDKLIGSAVEGLNDIEEKTMYVQEKTWTRFDFTINKKSDKEVFRPSDLEDGTYTLKISAEGEEKSFNFDVKDKKVVLPSYQDRAKHTDMPSFIEGRNGTENIYYYFKLN